MKEPGIIREFRAADNAAFRSHAFYRSVSFVQIDRSELPMSYDFPERGTLFFQLQL